MVLYMLFHLNVIFCLQAIYRWIYNMQIKALISKPSDVIVLKPTYFGVGCTKV